MNQHASLSVRAGLTKGAGDGVDQPICHTLFRSCSLQEEHVLTSSVATSNSGGNSYVDGFTQAPTRGIAPHEQQP